MEVDMLNRSVVAQEVRVDTQATNNNEINKNKKFHSDSNPKISEPKSADAKAVVYEGLKFMEGNNAQSENDVLDKAIEQANKRLVGTATHFRYNIHEKTNKITIKVVDSRTDEVIKEIPPEKTLDAVAKMWELAGIIVDEKS